MSQHSTENQPGSMYSLPTDCDSVPYKDDTQRSPVPTTHHPSPASLVDYDDAVIYKTIIVISNSGAVHKFKEIRKFNPSVPISSTLHITNLEHPNPYPLSYFHSDRLVYPDDSFAIPPTEDTPVSTVMAVTAASSDTSLHAPTPQFSMSTKPRRGRGQLTAQERPHSSPRIPLPILSVGNDKNNDPKPSILSVHCFLQH